MAGMHEPGWRGANEEAATEAWRTEALSHLAAIRAACDAVQSALWGDRAAEVITDATAAIDAATEELFEMRHGPEYPEDYQ